VSCNAASQIVTENTNVEGWQHTQLMQYFYCPAHYYSLLATNAERFIDQWIDTKHILMATEFKNCLPLHLTLYFTVTCCSKLSLGTYLCYSCRGNRFGHSCPQSLQFLSC
jgi:hypothetical protein